jgi:hypothetical protein
VPTLARVTIATLVLLVPLPAPAQPFPASPAEGRHIPAAAQPAPVAQPTPGPPIPYPIDAVLSTVVDHPGEFAGQAVRLRAARVDRIVSGTLVKLMDAREDGPYHFHIFYCPDRLLAALPAGTKVSKGDVVVVTGRLKTMRGASHAQDMTGVSAEQVKKYGNRAVLVATSVTTRDGVSLANAP